MVNANVQQYSAAAGQEQQQQQIAVPQHDVAASQGVQQFNGPPPQQQQQLRSPVLFKNQNNIVYIPYQQQLQRDQYPRPGSGGITKAKVQLISAYPPVRAPFPSEALEYGRIPQAPQFVPTKQEESFKELYIQQQRENHLRRLQAQAQQQQQQQQAADNLNQQSHAQPLSISLLPKKQAQPQQPPPPPPPQVVPVQPSANSNIAQFAEQLFQTPLDQQRPLSQEQFKALVAAGYPVQAVPVPIAVSGSNGPASAAQGPSYPPQLVQRYSPSTAGLAHPQPFSPKPVQSVVQVQYQQQQPSPPIHRHTAPAPQQQHHQQVPQQHHQPQQLPSQVHRFYPQGPYGQPQPQPNSGGQPNQHTTYRYRVPEGGVPQQHGPYTYILRQGENEESAAEQLRQQIIHQINAQQNGQKGALPNTAQQQAHQQQSSGGFTPIRTEYSPQQTVGQGQRAGPAPSPPPPQPLTEEQKEYYKRLEYY